MTVAQVVPNARSGTPERSTPEIKTMDTPNTSSRPNVDPTRTTLKTAGDVVRHVREVILTSVYGLNDFALRPQVDAHERLTLQTLATIRLRAADALSSHTNGWNKKVERTATQYSLVFRVALTLRDELKNTTTLPEANELLAQVDQTLIAALSNMKDGNSEIAELCESIIDIVFQMERQGNVAINGEQDM